MAEIQAVRGLTSTVESNLPTNATAASQTLTLTDYKTTCLEFSPGYGGRLICEESNVEFVPQAFRMDWSFEKGVRRKVDETGAHLFTIGKDSPLAKGRVWFKQVAAGIDAEYEMRVTSGCALAQLCVSADFPAGSTGSWAGDDYIVRHGETEIVTLRFSNPHPSVTFQDNRSWGLESSALRVLLDHREKAEKIGMHFVIASPGGAALGRRSSVELKSGAEWIPCRGCREVVPGSALDFSQLAGVRETAGRHGRVVCRGGRFEFENRQGTPCRFYGVNLCENANYPNREEASVLASRLARVGYNAVRFHHHDADWERDFARMDALAAACASNGIYYTTDLYVSRPVACRDIGLPGAGTMPIQDFKCLLPVHEGAFSNYVAFVRRFLNHTNVVTGVRWADDPALISLVLVNEGNPGNAGMRPYRESAEWRKAWGRAFPKDLSDPNDDLARTFRQFLAEKECAFFDRVRKIVRDELGCQAPLSDFNGWSESPEWSLPRKAVYDYVDDHFYVDHPDFLERAWCPPSRLCNENPFRKRWLGPERSTSKRVPGKPLAVSEWHFCAPGRYRGVAGLYTGAEAARAGWSGLWRFTWSHSLERAMRPDESPTVFFDVAADPLTLLSERAGIALFLRGDHGRTPLAIDTKSGAFTVLTERTCGGFAERGGFEAGALDVRFGDFPTTFFAIALDGQPLVDSRRILLAHLTELQNEGAAFGDLDRTIFLAPGHLPHLVRNGSARISLAMNVSPCAVWRLSADGSRVAKVAFDFRAGRVVFEVRVDADPQSATLAYEVVR